MSVFQKMVAMAGRDSDGKARAIKTDENGVQETKLTGSSVPLYPDMQSVQTKENKIADVASLSADADCTFLSPPVRLSPKDGKYNGFPALIRTEYGTILCAYRISTVHSQQDPGYQVIIKSDDLGRTWSEPEILTDERNINVDHRDCKFFQSSTGRIFLFYTWVEQDNSSRGIGYVTSDDGGGTWSDLKKINTEASNPHFYGNPIEHHYGFIWVPFYAGSRGMAIRSSNDGETWGTERVIFNNEATNEFSLVSITDFPGTTLGGVAAIARRDGNFNSLVKYSTDALATWSEAREIDLEAHSPELIMGKNNHMIMSYRTGTRSPLIAVSRDRGLNFQTVFQLHSRRGGYAQIAELGGGLYGIIYYVNEGTGTQHDSRWANVYLRYFKIEDIKQPEIQTYDYLSMSIEPGQTKSIYIETEKYSSFQVSGNAGNGLFGKAETMSIGYKMTRKRGTYDNNHILLRSQRIEFIDVIGPVRTGITKKTTVVGKEMKIEITNNLEETLNINSMEVRLFEE